MYGNWMDSHLMRSSLAVPPRCIAFSPFVMHLPPDDYGYERTHSIWLNTPNGSNRTTRCSHPATELSAKRATDKTPPYLFGVDSFTSIYRQIFKRRVKNESDIRSIQWCRHGILRKSVYNKGPEKWHSWYISMCLNRDVVEVRKATWD